MRFKGCGGLRAVSLFVNRSAMFVEAVTNTCQSNYVTSKIFEVYVWFLLSLSLPGPGCDLRETTVAQKGQTRTKKENANKKRKRKLKKEIANKK